MPITDVIPMPTPVILGGRHFLASEYRLSDIAELQSTFDDRNANPFEESCFALFHAPRNRDWRKLILDTVNAIEKQEGLFNDWLSTAESASYQVYLSLRRDSEGLTVDSLAEIISQSNHTPILLEVEISRILRIAWAIKPNDMLREMIDGPKLTQPGDTDWAGAYHSYVTTAKGPAPPFDQLTLTQYRVWATGGVDADDGRSDFAEVAIKRSRFFEGVEN